MFIGHFAASFALSSAESQRGSLAYITLSSVLPDVLMLGLGLLGSRWNYHADWGLLVCVAILIFIAGIAKLSIRAMVLAALALLIHLIFDLPYMSHDSSNLYAQPWLDFFLEGGLFIAGSILYLARQHLGGRERRVFLALSLFILVSQAVWNFAYSPHFW